MLDYHLRDSDGILHLKPSTPLLAREFAQLNEVGSRYLATHEDSIGLLIQSEDPLGWEDLCEQVTHIHFGPQHQRVRKIAIISAPDPMRCLPPISTYFCQAEVRHFPSQELERAHLWLQAHA